MEDLFHIQRELEVDMRVATRSRYFSNHEKASERGEFAETHAGRNTLKFMLGPFTDGVEAWVASVDAAPGKLAHAAVLIKDFDDVPTMSYIFLKHIISMVLHPTSSGRAKQARKTKTILAAVQAIHDEHRMRYFEKNRKALLKRIVKDFNERDLPRRRRRELMMKQFQRQKLEWVATGWDVASRTKLGVVLFEILKTTTGIVEEYQIFERKKPINCAAFTEEFVERIRANMEEAADFFTVYYPTVMPPRPWKADNLVSGGYWTDNVAPYPLVKDAKVQYISDLEASNPVDVVSAINTVQETPWRVNKTMLSVLETVWQRGIPVKGLPPANPQEIPPAPPGIEDNEELQKEYRKACYIVHDTNRRDISKRISVMRTISLANKFKEFPAIYFPHDLDSRGRAYPKPAFLNPQGTDYVKALLEFSEGMTIDTEEDAAFLAIGIANAWGQDKLPLQERVDWVLDNEAMLLDVALNPIGDLRWTQADEPFMALRGALEWSNFVNFGYGVTTRMPVHFDATCSGLQHFSALLRDEVGGFYVNLTDTGARQDIYAEVARKATETLKASDDPLAPVALEIGVSRALCKRPVMIVPYSGTRTACMEYVFDHYKEMLASGVSFPIDFETIQTKLTPLVSEHVWNAISSTVIAASEAMSWITKSARSIVRQGPTAPFQWVTPDGFTVQQLKLELESKKIRTYFDGKVISANILQRSNPAALDSRQMAQSLSPNYIHSMDACHMRMSVNAASHLTISFAVIHDSFGVHAPVMRRFLDEAIKPAFVQMYDGHNRLAEFAEQLRANLPEGAEDFDPLPEPGSLDVADVLRSEFFFS